MAAFTDTISEKITLMSTKFGALSNMHKMLAGGGVLVLIVALVLVVSLRNTGDWSYLYKNIDGNDSQEIINYFNNNNIKDWKQDDIGIQVKSKELLNLRVKLSQEGLPSHGQIGWENFDNKDFTKTEFEQNIQKLRALQGELARTIALIENVQSSRVHIVIPKKSLFVRAQKPATAAIYLKTKRSAVLTAKQIKGIVHLVASSVEGLENNNVTVLDSQGNMLTEKQAKNFSSRLMKERFQYKVAIEDKIESKIRSLVGKVVGYEKVEVKVDAKLNFSQLKRTISDVDPERAAVVSKSTTGFKLKGSGLNPTGIPGAKSNVPGEEEKGATGSSNSTENSKDSETVNYQFKSVVSEEIMPMGNIEKLSVSVLVDGKQINNNANQEPEFIPRSEKEMKALEELVKSSVNYDQKRGDIVTIRNMIFQLDSHQIETIKEETNVNRKYIMTLASSAAVAIALVLFFVFIVRPYFRWLSYDPERKISQQAVEEFRPELEMKTFQNIQVKEEVPFDKLSPQEQVISLAKNDPIRTTEAIRMVLNPHKNG